MTSAQYKINAVLSEMDGILGSRERTIEVILCQSLQFLLVGVADKQLEKANTTEKLCDLWLSRKQLHQNLRKVTS